MLSFSFSFSFHILKSIFFPISFLFFFSKGKIFKHKNIFSIMVTYGELINVGLVMATVFGLIVMFAAWFNGRRTVVKLGGAIGELKDVVVRENELTRKELGERLDKVERTLVGIGETLSKILHAIEARGV
jgi:Zn-dependent protease with chaperone function